MPEMPDVVPSELVEADWGNDIRDRTIQRFNNWTDAIAAYPSPSDGDTIVILDPNLFGVYTWVVNRWQSSPDTGTIMAFAGLFGSPVPRGWMICQGTAVSRTTYARLFAVCGTAFGDGDGSTTFNLPNLVNSFPRGAPAANLGDTGGSDTHAHALRNRSLGNAGAGGTGIIQRNAGIGGIDPPDTDTVNHLPPYVNVRYIIKT